MTDRKALLRAYKEKKPQARVSQLRNRNNGKLLVGSTTTLARIWNSIHVQLSGGGHMSAQLQADFSGNPFSTLPWSHRKQVE
jgi:hypothetical protein